MSQNSNQWQSQFHKAPGVVLSSQPSKTAKKKLLFLNQKKRQQQILTFITEGGARGIFD